MTALPPSKLENRVDLHPHSPHEEGPSSDLHDSTGVPIQCQFCPGQSFRRSRLRLQDVQQIFLMRYPVRCLRCSQRQMVSFTVAGISVPSHVKQRRARAAMKVHRNATEPSSTQVTPSPSEARPASPAEPD